MKISKVKELVLANELAIENDSTVDKLNNVIGFVFGYKYGIRGVWKFYTLCPIYEDDWFGVDETNLPRIKVSEITFENFKDQVIELRKKYPNDFEFGGAVSKLLNE